MDVFNWFKEHKEFDLALLVIAALAVAYRLFRRPAAPTVQAPVATSPDPASPAGVATQANPSNAPDVYLIHEFYDPFQAVANYYHINQPPPAPAPAPTPVSDPSPTGFSMSDHTGTGATFVWTNPGADVFTNMYLQWKDQAGGDWKQGPSMLGHATSGTITGLNPTRQYAVRVVGIIPTRGQNDPYAHTNYYSDTVIVNPIAWHPGVISSSGVSPVAMAGDYTQNRFFHPLAAAMPNGAI